MIAPLSMPRRLAAGLLLSLAAALPAHGAQVGKRPPVRRPASPATSTAIIPLPLQPVVPAAQRSCSTRTASGLGYTMLRPAAGAKPGASDLVLVNYIGYLAATGVVFDQGMRAALSVDGVIPGFSEGLRLMSSTSIARFCIPAALGYGARATGPIPANADLVFQVELIDHKAADAPAVAPDAPPAEPAAGKNPA